MTREEFDNAWEKIDIIEGCSIGYSCSQTDRLVDSYISSLEQQLSDYKKRIEELEAHRSCDGCKYITTTGCTHWSAHQEDCCNRYPNLHDYYEPKKDKQ